MLNENEIIALAQSGDGEAMRKILIQHDKWLKKTARYFFKKARLYTEIEDVEQLCAIGLMRGVIDFDASRGARLTTMARYYILNELNKSNIWDNIILRTRSERSGTCRRDRIPVLSMEVLTSGSSAECYTERKIGVEASQEDGIAERENRRAVNAALRSLTARQRTIIRNRYYKGKTLKMSGAEFGITRERTRQIEQEAFLKLKKQLAKLGITKAALEQ
jgi:RNA polymerase sigma factor (sigma-70 family)